VINVPVSVALPMPLIVTFATKESSVWAGLVLITLVPVTFEPLSSKNGAPKIVSIVALVLTCDVIVGVGVIVCANILGNPMNPTNNAIVAAVDIPILKVNFTVMWLEYNDRI
jgi:hypothetical protein